jgi:hypothetical protein
MKSNLSPIFVFVTIIFLSACGASDKAKETANNLSALKDMAENISKNAEKVNDKIAERKAKGDTLALPYKDLQAYLPEIAGYEKKGDPKGETVNMAGLSFSNTKQKYTKGDQEITVSITDYNSAYSIFTGVTAMMNAGFSVDNDDETAKGVDLGINGIKGFETIKKKRKRATLVVAISERFFVQLEGENLENTDALKDIVKGMDLAKLADM